MAPIRRSSFAHARPAPRRAPGPPKPITDSVAWTRIVQPREIYRVRYLDRNNEESERVIELAKMGTIDGTPYLGVQDGGRFKTLRADRITAVLEQLSQGHPASIHAQPGYASWLPSFPIADAIHKVSQTANAKRTWTVDLNRYTCACPERRIRAGAGYAPGQLGFVCSHVARAILDHLPSDSNWPHELLQFLAEPRKMHIVNLV